MLPVSAAFQAAVRGTHTAETRVEAWYAGTRIATIEADNRLPGLVDGTVTVDAGQAVRRSYSASFATPGAFPGVTDYRGAFSPYGTLHKVWRGVVYASGVKEWVQLGTFRLDNPGTPLEPGPMKASGADLAKHVADNRFLQPTNSVTTNTVPVEIARHVRGGMNSPTYPVRDLTGNTSLTPAMTWDQDRWGAMRDLALSIGAELVFGVDGTCLIQPVPKVTNPVVWTVTVPEIMITGSIELERSQTYNCVVAAGERSDGVPPARAVAYDTNPASPTYVGNPIGSGPYGLVPAFYSSPSLSTNAACLKAASAILGRVRGMTRRVAFECVPNPAVDVGDVMRLNLLDGTSEIHIVDSLQIPLSVEGTMRVTTRTSNEPGIS
jgi:hypothetical protein